MKTEQVFTIAISGCSSAGKSTLAFLLSEIFGEIRVDVSSDDSDVVGNEASGTDIPPIAKDSNALSASQKVPIIHGDEFFLPKHLCHLITFISTPSDRAFCQASLLSDEIGQHIISWNGTRANDTFMTHTPSLEVTATSASDSTALAVEDLREQGQGVPSNESVMTTFSMASTLHEGGRNKIFTISGPDTDCDEAVNFVGMFEKLKEMSWKELNIDGAALSVGELGSEKDAASGALKEKLENEKKAGRGSSTESLEIDENEPIYSHHHIDISTLRAQHADLISQMRERIQIFLKETVQATKEAEKSSSWLKPASQTLVEISPLGTATFLPRITIIESFLLFTQPSTLTPSDHNPNIKRCASILRTFLSRLSSISTAPASKDGVDEELEVERAYVEKNIWRVNSACKKGMMGVFDVKLFLGTTGETARRRRFERGVYRDGEGRVAGQMWKAEGYWDQIAWVNYLAANGWLISGEEAERKSGYTREGVWVRGEDWGVKETVEWAVGCVLEEMRGLVKGGVEKGYEGGLI